MKQTRWAAIFKVQVTVGVQTTGGSTLVMYNCMFKQAWYCDVRLHAIYIHRNVIAFVQVILGGGKREFYNRNDGLSLPEVKVFCLFLFLGIILYRCRYIGISCLLIHLYAV